jgi:hypothetical protein
VKQQIAPQTFLERENEIRYRITWRCKLKDTHRTVTHTCQEVFATPAAARQAVAMVLKNPPPCPNGCEPAEVTK